MTGQSRLSLSSLLGQSAPAQPSRDEGGIGVFHQLANLTGMPIIGGATGGAIAAGTGEGRETLGRLQRSMMPITQADVIKAVQDRVTHPFEAEPMNLAKRFAGRAGPMVVGGGLAGLIAAAIINNFSGRKS